jgi:hypothetical protein
VAFYLRFLKGPRKGLEVAHQSGRLGPQIGGKRFRELRSIEE